MHIISTYSLQTRAHMGYASYKCLTRLWGDGCRVRVRIRVRVRRLWGDGCTHTTVAPIPQQNCNCSHNKTLGCRPGHATFHHLQCTIAVCRFLYPGLCDEVTIKPSLTCWPSCTLHGTGIKAGLDRHSSSIVLH